jgi:hypothetical protein
MAILPGGIGSADVAAWTSAPNWLVMICWPAKIGTAASLPLRAVVSVC